MSENLRHFTTAVYNMDAVVHRVPEGAWDNPSPCEGWSARDVVAHQVGVFAGATAIIRTGEIARPAEPEERADPVGMWTAARTNILEALDRPGVLQQQGTYWFGDMTIDQFIGMVRWDPFTHAWDVATATGIDAHLDETVAKSCYDMIVPMRDMLAKRKLISETPVEVPADADIVSRYLGLVGRNPNL